MIARHSVALAVLVLLGSLPMLAPAADTYQLDAVHSAVLFRIKHLQVGYLYGRFNDVAGSLVIDETDPSKNSLQVQVKADSVDSANAKRDAHLKGPDFFNTKEFPQMTFQSKEFKPVQGGYEVAGTLTVHGQTQPLTVKLERIGTGKDPFGGTRTGVETTFVIKRSDYGMKFMVGPIADEVRITVALEGVLQR
jgi:polyisoprenoid-binding protein YceI